jgi:hypothetical protein
VTVETRFSIVGGEVADAEIALGKAIVEMCQKRHINRSASEIIKEIKATLNVRIPPFGMTVIETLCHRERDKAFARLLDEPGLSGLASRGQKEIRDFLQDIGTPARKRKQIATNTFSVEPGKYRRLRREVGSAEEPHPNPSPAKLLSTAKGRPEEFDAQVVWVFMQTIARAAGLGQFEPGDRDGNGAMFKVLLRAMEWGLAIASLGSRGSSRPRPKLNSQSLQIMIRGLLTNTTD